MVSYTQKVIADIRAAGSESAVEAVIANALEGLQSEKINHFNARRRFTLNLLVALNSLKAEDLSPSDTARVSAATVILEKMRESEIENLF